MNFYLDTSVMVAALTGERRTGEVQEWLDKRQPGDLAISDWVVAEFSAAISRKMRMSQMKAAERAEAEAAFARLIGESLLVLPVSASHFRAAARFAERHDLSLRAPDALHLAVGADHGAILCTLDRRLADAGAKLGVKSKLL